MTNLWMKTLLAFVFASGIAIPIYWKYRFKHAEKEEKQLMISQKKIYHFYYDRWYTPADSTELYYQIERIKKRKKPIKQL
jgi:protein tyrosine phosphatase